MNIIALRLLHYRFSPESRPGFLNRGKYGLPIWQVFWLTILSQFPSHLLLSQRTVVYSLRDIPGLLSEIRDNCLQLRG